MSTRGLRAGWIVFGIVAGTLVGLGLSAKPWARASEERARMRAAQDEMAAEEARRADLESRVAEAQSALGRERLARERGYVRPGEVPLERRP